MMNYNEFKEKITTEIKNEITTLYPTLRITMQKVTKNNGLILEGLVLAGDSAVAPTVYLNYLYESYLSGQTFANLVSKVLDTIDAGSQMEAAFELDKMTWETARSKIFIQVVGEKENQLFKATMPCRKELDMLFTYRILIDQAEDGIASCHITNALQEYLQVTEEMLYGAAMHNMPQLFPAYLEDIACVIDSMMYDAPTAISNVENTLKTINKNQPMYVLTNTCKSFGATVLFYPELLEKVSQAFDCNMFVLPSSIHETLLLPYEQGLTMGMKDLKLMVYEINHTQVSPEEVLTDQVYLYDQNAKKLMIADEWQKAQS